MNTSSKQQQFTSQLLIICVVLFIVPLFGRDLFPETFNVWYMQYPTLALLAVLLPIGLVNSLTMIHKDNNAEKSALFLLVSLVLITGPVVVNVSMNSNATLIASDVNPQNEMTTQLIKMTNNDVANIRFFGAQEFFKRYGEPIFYRDDKGDFVKYTPSEEDLSAYKDYKSSNDELEKVRVSMSALSIETIYITFGFVSIYFIFFCLTLYRNIRVVKT